MQTENPEVVETEIPNDEIVDAIDEELVIVDTYSEPEPENDPEPEPEKDPEPDPEPEKEPEPDPEPGKDPEPEPEKKEDDPKEPEPEPEKDPEPKAEEKPSDEFGTLEEGTPERTRERFETVKEKYDGVVAERDAIRAEADQWVNAIKGTGTNPEQFAMSLEYLSLVNSGKPEDLNKAYDIMQGELTDLAKSLGRPAPGGYNPLDEHPDLKQKVDDGYMDEAAALEVVQARATTKLAQTSESATAAETAHNTSVTNALENVKQLGMQLKASDPNFEAKAQMLAPIIESVVTSGASPDKWKDMIAATYAKIPEPAAAPAPTPPKPTAPNPIRPTSTSPASSSIHEEPGSELEAINQALERGY